MQNKTGLIDGGGVLTDDRYAMIWLSQACLCYLYLAWLGQKENQIWLANKSVGSLITKDTRNWFCCNFASSNDVMLLYTKDCISALKNYYATDIFDTRIYHINLLKK